MVVRIRVTNTGLFVWRNQPPAGSISSRLPRLEKFALATASLLIPSALLAFTMGIWVIASELRGAGDFFLTHGLFSHWQVWIRTAGVLLVLARLLGKYAREPEVYSFSDERSIRP